MKWCIHWQLILYCWCFHRFLHSYLLLMLRSGINLLSPCSRSFFCVSGWGLLLAILSATISSWIFVLNCAKLNTDKPLAAPLRTLKKNHFLLDLSTTTDKTTGTPAQTGLILDNQQLCEARPLQPNPRPAGLCPAKAVKTDIRSPWMQTSLSFGALLMLFHFRFHFCSYCQHFSFCALQSMGSGLEMDRYQLL